MCIRYFITGTADMNTVYRSTTVLHHVLQLFKDSSILQPEHDEIFDPRRLYVEAD